MKKVCSLFIFLFLSFSSFAQDQEGLVGKWIFSDLYNADNLDEASISIAKTQLEGQLYFLLENNNSFEASIMGETSTGQWLLTDEKHLKLVTEETTFEFEILNYTTKEIALQIGEGSFLMKKTE